MTHSNDYLKEKTILVTGACGTVGGELVRQLLEECRVKELIGIDNNESELFFLDQRYLKYDHAHFALGDVRDKDKMIRRMRGVDIVFHAAALKHVILCERSPFDAVQTNINGMQNIISAACENKVKKVIFTSSDKAVNPTNVMGTSKLMGERLITAANSNLRGLDTVFSSTRFGNVLGSRGSVIPVFRKQISRGGPVTVTDPAMTRFIMSIQDAVRLVVDSASLAKGGEVFITKMPVLRIMDLAEVMIEELGSEFGYDPADIEIVVTGVKPGEKMYEELMSEEETRRTLELDRYFAVTPAFTSLYRNIQYDYPNLICRNVTKAYHSASEGYMSKQEISFFLHTNGLLRASSETEENSCASSAGQLKALPN